MHGGLGGHLGCRRHLHLVSTPGHCSKTHVQVRMCSLTFVFTEFQWVDLIDIPQKCTHRYAHVNSCQKFVLWSRVERSVNFDSSCHLTRKYCISHGCADLPRHCASYRTVFYMSGLRPHYVKAGKYVYCYGERGAPRDDRSSLLLVHGFSSSKDQWVQIVQVCV